MIWSSDEAFWWEIFRTLIFLGLFSSFHPGLCLYWVRNGKLLDVFDEPLHWNMETGDWRGSKKQNVPQHSAKMWVVDASWMEWSISWKLMLEVRRLRYAYMELEVKRQKTVVHQSIVVFVANAAGGVWKNENIFYLGLCTYEVCSNFETMNRPVRM